VKIFGWLPTKVIAGQSISFPLTCSQTYVNGPVPPVKFTVTEFVVTGTRTDSLTALTVTLTIPLTVVMAVPLALVRESTRKKALPLKSDALIVPDIMFAIERTF
jgi:hypothetical protein